METAIRNTTLQDKDFLGFWILDFRLGSPEKSVKFPERSPNPSDIKVQKAPEGRCSVEPMTLTAATIAALFFSDVARQGSKSLGAGVSQTTTQRAKLYAVFLLNSQKFTLNPDCAVSSVETHGHFRNKQPGLLSRRISLILEWISGRFALLNSRSFSNGETSIAAALIKVIAMILITLIIAI